MRQSSKLINTHTSHFGIEVCAFQISALAAKLAQVRLIVAGLCTIFIISLVVAIWQTTAYSANDKYISIWHFRARASHTIRHNVTQQFTAKLAAYQNQRYSLHFFVRYFVNT